MHSFHVSKSQYMKKGACFLLLENLEMVGLFLGTIYCADSMHEYLHILRHTYVVCVLDGFECS
jgi:hypothetical protein